MKLRELIETAEGVYFAGYCSCGCGEACYDLITNDDLVYPVIGEKTIREVKPELLDAPKIYDGHGTVDVAE